MWSKELLESSINGITCGGSKFVAVGDARKVAYSNNQE
jgi:hypothetical protein